MRFSLPLIIITITSNEPWNKETRKTVRNPPITNHRPWPFEPVEVNFCFLRGPLRLLTAAKNVKVSCVLNFRIRVFLKSAVSKIKSFVESEHLNIISRIKSVRPLTCYLTFRLRKSIGVAHVKHWNTFLADFQLTANGGADCIKSSTVKPCRFKISCKSVGTILPFPLSWLELLASLAHTLGKDDDRLSWLLSNESVSSPSLSTEFSSEVDSHDKLTDDSQFELRHFISNEFLSPSKSFAEELLRAFIISMRCWSKAVQLVHFSPWQLVFQASKSPFAHLHLLRGVGGGGANKVYYGRWANGEFINSTCSATKMHVENHQ